MKLLTKLRELRNQPSNLSTCNFLNSTCEIDFETIGIGAITTSDIARLNLQTQNFKEISIPKS